MSFFQQVDNILFTLCNQGMTSASERYYITPRRFSKFHNLPLNAALAICELREKSRN